MLVLVILVPACVASRKQMSNDMSVASLLVTSRVSLFLFASALALNAQGLRGTSGSGSSAALSVHCALLHTHTGTQNARTQRNGISQIA